MKAQRFTLWMTPVLLVAAAGSLAAQNAPTPFTCAASARAVPVRAEGTTELVADVVVTCTGGVPTIDDGVQIPQSDIQFVFNSNVTSRILGLNGASEALLVLDEAQPGAQFPCDSATGICIGFGNALGFGYYGPGPQSNRNLFQGLVNGSFRQITTTPQTIIWPSIPVDPPGTGLTRVFRFTNVRLDATTAKGGALILSSINFAAFDLTVTNVPLVVAVPQTSLSATVRDSGNVTTTPFGAPVPVTPNGSTLTKYATLRFASTIGGADRPRTAAGFLNQDFSPPPALQNIPGGVFSSESGFFNPAFGTFGPGGNLGTAGLADTGTRYMAVFTNIPAGFNLFVDVYNSTASTGPTARLVNTDTTGSGPFAVTFGTGLIAPVLVNGGTAVATWEVLRNTGALDQFDFGVYLVFGPGFGFLPSPAGIQMRYAPFPQSADVPQFSAISNSQTLFTFVPPPGLIASPANLAYFGTAGGRSPASQPLNLISTINSIPVSFNLVSTGTLALQLQSATGVTPSTLSVSVNSQGLASGTYRDTITIVPNNGTARITIPVTLGLNPGPQITSVTPPTILVGGPALTLTVNGTNLFPGTAVQWNGVALATTFVSLAQLTAQVPAALVATPNVASVTAVTLDGSLSNAVLIPVGTFTIASLSPSTVSAGGSGFNLTINGTGFVAGDAVNIGGSVLQVASVAATQIVVTVPPNIIAQAGALAVTVIGPSGLSSNSVNLTVAPPFLINTIAPAAVTATAPAFTMTIAGAGFGTGATVQVGGTTLQPATLAPGQITVSIPANLIAAAGTLPVTVTGAAGLVTNAVLLVVNPAPAITVLGPPAVTAGNPGLVLNVTGTNLPQGSVVQLSGQPLATTVVSTTQLTAVLTPDVLNTARSWSISVLTADGAASNALPFLVNPAPVISTLGPSSAVLGAAAFTLTVTGTGFADGYVVQWNGQNLATGFVSATQMTAQVSAGLLAAASTASVNVATPDGIRSNTVRFTISLPPLTGVIVTVPNVSPSGQDQTVTVTLGRYPVDLVGTVTLTFTGDSGLPDDPAIQFQNQTRVFTFTVPAGTLPNLPQLTVKTGTIAGVISIVTTFSAGGVDVTPAGSAPQRIQVSRAAPSLTSVTCPRNATGFTVVIDGYTNTREATQATFDFQAASGATLGTSELVATATPIFSSFFGGSASAGIGGVFRYTQPFTVQGSPTTVASVTVKLGNSAGTSAAVTCQLQ